MKIAFFGTGEFSKNIGENLIKNFSQDIEIRLMVSQPDKPVGRKKIITKTPVKILAEENNIEILQPTRLKNNTEFFGQLEGFDFIVVVAYGKIIPTEVLKAPKYGCINIHGSILPNYRGASPIQESIKNGDAETGVTIMYMSEGMDEGDILSIKKVPIETRDKTEDIFKKFEEVGPELLIKTLKQIINGEIQGKTQEESEATYCSKIMKTDGEIDFSQETAQVIYNKFRAYSTWPGIYTYYKGKKFSIEDCDILVTPGEKYKNGEVIKGENKQIGIACREGTIVLKQVKLEGKKSMDILSFINGNKDFLDHKF